MFSRRRPPQAAQPADLNTPPPSPAEVRNRALTLAITFIQYRPRAEAEVRERLQVAEFAPEVVEEVLGFLRKEGALNDARFASQWVAGRTGARPRGARALAQELRQRGVDREQIEAALPDEDSEAENAITALRPQMRRYAHLGESEQRQKAFGWMQRRGFSLSIASRAIQTLLNEDS